ncbi:type 2 isopentenyl-diphosphate Delta-isomerase [Labilibaculum manganireducens]|uniref:Type 2 isopentenyl-diphosphate Delta-isomerase n=1 Tax=Labilibaculum manganireducens TaxID=1940525 RepID=A0A2N3I7V3_9BACT|nr:type 2 isopentenyl-diphosphate Delta-isomerase [Labilibaculum manganireducens]PKQ66379.1 type 2 isopentenyl-diphosphate Delta-isomerase [Labilibaculum manganireducens]
MTDRKKDHIELAFRSQMKDALIDERFYYEPMLSSHPKADDTTFTFLGKDMQTPIWVSSMTGGTELAGKINRNLARACAEFGMGMGLGSCRSLLDSDEYFSDFDVRSIIGDDLPLYANLGICQLEELIQKKKISKIIRLVGRLRADGLIIHINPMQEWLQPEGDRINQSPIDSLEYLLDEVDFPIIVKEVGQGMGPESLRALLHLPLQAIEFAAFGGTNFAKIELLRHSDSQIKLFEPLAQIGHSANQMTDWVNEIVASDDQVKCKEIIISGGIQNFLDGYYLIEKSTLPAIYGQASSLLKYAKESYEELRAYLESQRKGLQLSKSFLRVRK